MYQIKRKPIISSSWVNKYLLTKCKCNVQDLLTCALASGLDMFEDYNTALQVESHRYLLLQGPGDNFSFSNLFEIPFSNNFLKHRVCSKKGIRLEGKMCYLLIAGRRVSSCLQFAQFSSLGFYKFHSLLELWFITYHLYYLYNFFFTLTPHLFFIQK